MSSLVSGLPKRPYKDVESSDEDKIQAKTRLSKRLRAIVEPTQTVSGCEELFLLHDGDDPPQDGGALLQDDDELLRDDDELSWDDDELSWVDNDDDNEEAEVIQGNNKLLPEYEGSSHVHEEPIQGDDETPLSSIAVPKVAGGKERHIQFRGQRTDIGRSATTTAASAPVQVLPAIVIDHESRLQEKLNKTRSNLARLRKMAAEVENAAVMRRRRSRRPFK